MTSYDMDSEAVGQQDKDKVKISFRFCRECSNMLYPAEDKISHELMFSCRMCAYSEKAETTCVFRNALRDEIAETPGNYKEVAEDPTLPHTEDEQCAQCGERDAVFFQSQQRTRETGMALFFVCVNCNHCWSTLDRIK
ncbi:hypothetical protein BAUCODRAFT_31455 [Baudoinia panamericana UAMH 10762]|uniref:DNA-directed RNA polymerase subunit n=1 Tax=Baudoinia panamericana (strain UAMH 10762) TaxID=717646 RepID=M2LWU2_BAUPA|nr:uncharacterized protein BAUCODRAFT_31455 [Baudoinia panamericana UAMH 10762]EMC99142.1 hypothetical protein BAUCODRAFT_31455 [Baudoinia panamericana UAMH 10762]